MKDNTNTFKQHTNKRVILKDGRQGKLMHAGYDICSIDLDCGWWWCGPVTDIAKVLEK